MANPAKTDIQIPGYTILRELGHGGMAHVYLAIQESFGREVALKILSPHLTDDEQFSKRFLREARIVSQLNHPNIVTVYDAGKRGKYHYMSMEYIPGKDLRQLKDSLSRKDVLRIVKDVASALEFAGSKGIVHRDVKPENIMIHETDKRVILMDFGIAHGNDMTQGMTQTGKAIGTPHFMSPEQTKGLKVDHRSDIYSLGIVLFQLLAGHLPFDADSAVAVGIKHLTSPIPRLPAGLEIFQPIVNSCLSKQPEHRYQKASDLIAALDKINDEQLEKINTQAILFKQAGVDQDAETQVSNTPAVAQKSKIPPLVFPSSKNNSSIGEQEKELPGSNRRRNLLFLLLLCTIAYAANEKQNELKQYWGEVLIPGIVKVYPDSLPRKYLQALQKTVSTTQNNKHQSTFTVSVEAPSPQNLVNANKPAVVPQALKQEPKPLSTEEKISLLNDGLDDHPENAIELASIYKELLQQERGNPVALRGLRNLREWYTRQIRETFSTNDMEQAHRYVEIMHQSFPRATQSNRFQQLERKIAFQDNINTHMQIAEQYFKSGALSKPVDKNALSEVRKVLNLAPGYEPAKQFIVKITNAYLEQTNQLQNQGNLQNALIMVEEGIAALDNNLVLLNKREELKNIIKDKNYISSTLKRAQQYFDQGHFIEPEGWCAYDLYQKVLDKDKNNLRAKAGLKTIHQEYAKNILTTIRRGDLTQAEFNLNAAIQRFGHTPLLANVKLKLNDAIKARQAK